MRNEMTKKYKYNIKTPVDDFNRINKAFKTADKITAEANGDGPKWNLHVEGLNPAEMSVITQWLEHLRPGVIKENNLVYVLGSFDANKYRED